MSADLTISHARRKLELGIERQTAIINAQEARKALARRNSEDAGRKLDEAKRRRIWLSENLADLKAAEQAAEKLP